MRKSENLFNSPSSSFFRFPGTNKESNVTVRCKSNVNKVSSARKQRKVPVEFELTLTATPPRSTYNFLYKINIYIPGSHLTPDTAFGLICSSREHVFSSEACSARVRCNIPLLPARVVSWATYRIGPLTPCLLW